MGIELELQNETREPLPTREDMTQWLGQALLHLDTPDDDIQLTIRVVTPEEIHNLNHHYRQKDKPTNILSFPFEWPDEVPTESTAQYLGDLVVCAEIVAAEAQQQGKPLHHHWAHMLIHGFLHLNGFDHQDDAEAREMEALEIEILSSMGVANPYKEAIIDDEM